MNHLFYDKLYDFVTICLDDILVFSCLIKEHEDHLHWFLKQLQKQSLKAKMKKHCFCVPKLKYLGYIVIPFGVNGLRKN